MRVSLFLLLLFFFFPFGTEAARFYLEAPADPGQRAPIRVLVDTENESLNAFEGTVYLSGESVRTVRVEDAGSIVSVWLEHPKEGSTIRFSGITPGGFQGERGSLFTIIAEGAGEARFSFVGVHAYRNDGAGTETASRAELLKFTFGDRAAEDVFDAERPESFSISLVETPDSFEGKKVLVFSAQDKGTGIARYEVCEGLFSCATSVSPHAIEDEHQGVFIVRAYDFEGNERTAILFTDTAKFTYGAAILALILISIVVAYFIRRRSHAR